MNHSHAKEISRPKVMISATRKLNPAKGNRKKKISLLQHICRTYSLETEAKSSTAATVQ
jgi:hypothetical protein